MSNWKSFFIGIVACVSFLFVAVLISNLPLLWALGKSGALSVGLVISIFGALFTNTTALLAIVTVVNAGLFGVIVAVAVKVQPSARLNLAPPQKSRKSSFWTTSGGTFLTLFGTGCASCGALFLGGVLPFAGGGALLALLPLEGGEFALAGTLLLFFALWQLLKGRRFAAVCNVIDGRQGKA